MTWCIREKYAILVAQTTQLGVSLRQFGPQIRTKLLVLIPSNLITTWSTGQNLSVSWLMFAVHMVWGLSPIHPWQQVFYPINTSVTRQNLNQPAWVVLNDVIIMKKVGQSMTQSRNWLNKWVKRSHKYP